MDALTYKNEPILASAENDTGQIFSVNTDNNNEDQDIDFIPKRLVLCGEDSDGNIKPVLMDSNRRINY